MNTVATKKQNLLHKLLSIYVADINNEGLVCYANHHHNLIFEKVQEKRKSITDTRIRINTAPILVLTSA